MFDAKSILDQFISKQSAGAENRSGGGSNMSGLAGGALAGGLAALLAGTKTGRKIGKTALTYGGTALVGGLAYKAWSNWRAGQSAGAAEAASLASPDAFQPPPAGSAFLPAVGKEKAFNRSLIRAMVAAAHADGQIDSSEQQRIFHAVNEMGLSTEDKAFVMDELASPSDISGVAAAATCHETAAELYLASLLAIDEAGVAERDYLIRLAASLNLEPGLLQYLHASAVEARRA